MSDKGTKIKWNRGLCKWIDLQQEIEGFKTVYGDRFIGMRNGWPIVLGKTRIPAVRRVR